jgi:alkylated DNA repair dioxygenase AlkB
MQCPSGFHPHELTEGNLLFVGCLPDHLLGDDASFELLWGLQPTQRPWIKMAGRPVQIPRNQQAYGADYAFSGQISRALQVPEVLLPYLDWSREVIDCRLNGLLVNWYDGATADYIGPHHDKTTALVKDTPIVTISCGASRTFRLTRGRGTDREVRDFEAGSGTVFVMPWQTNRAWKHEVPHFARNAGRRISITVRAFVESATPRAPVIAKGSQAIVEHPR